MFHAAVPRPSLQARWNQAPQPLLIATVAGCLAYLITAAATFGLRAEQVIVCALAVLAALWSDRTRRLLVGVLPFVLLGVLYDLSRLLQPLLAHLTVHVREPFHFDLTFFGIDTPAGRITPAQLFLTRHWPWVDLVTGTAYILYLYEAIGFGVGLALSRSETSRRMLARFGWTMLALNVAGIATYYLYPAAPPWYVNTHGFGPVDLATAPNPAAAARWDALTGIPYFANFYARGASVFGAIPSLHAAYPLLVFLYVRELRRPIWAALAFAFFALVCFSAVYLQHHYVLDLLVGAAYAASAYLAERLLTRRCPSRRSPSMNAVGGSTVTAPAA